MLPTINPPLLNSSNPWATTAEDLQKLFDCPYTGAVTTRTSLLNGFEHNDAVHQYTFFDSSGSAARPKEPDGHVPSAFSGSLNTLGYSPLSLSTYLAMLAKVVADSALPSEQKSKKVFIISVTGSAEAVVECHRRIEALQANMENYLCMEINLSCPNIPSRPPPAYSGEALTEYLDALATATQQTNAVRKIAIGVKTPPYTYHDQFATMINALASSASRKGGRCPIDFITATNTLGSSLVLSDTNGIPAINSASGAGIGGMAGAPLHPLALGNVKSIRTMLDQHDELRDIDIVGIGGVSDQSGFERMRSVGAKVVGVGTALGRSGVRIFKDILPEED